MRMKKQKLSADVWSKLWANMAGVNCARFIGITDCGLAGIVIGEDGGAELTPSDVAEVIGYRARGASFDEYGNLYAFRK